MKLKLIILLVLINNYTIYNLFASNIDTNKNTDFDIANFENIKCCHKGNSKLYFKFLPPELEENGGGEFILKIIEMDKSLCVDLKIPEGNSFSFQIEEISKRYYPLKIRDYNEIVKHKSYSKYFPKASPVFNIYSNFRKLSFDFKYLDYIFLHVPTCEVFIEVFGDSTISCKFPFVKESSVYSYFDKLFTEIEKELQVKFYNKESNKDTLYSDNNLLQLRDECFQLSKMNGSIIFEKLNECTDKNVKKSFIQWELLSYLICGEDIEKLKYLAKKGVDFSIKNFEKDTLLLPAASVGNLGIVKFLLNQGVDINQVNKFNQNALHYYLWADSYNEDIAIYLINKGININIQDTNKETPLYLAVKNNLIRVFEKLLELNVNLDKRNSFGENILITTIKENHFDMSKKLLAKSHDFFGKDIYGWDALLHASKIGNCDVVNLLLQNKFNANTCDNFGYTPLMIAAWNGHLETVKLLCKAGADKSLKVQKGDYKGYTALKFAKESYYPEIVKLLKDF